MKKHRYRGFICMAGLWRPQIQLQITPLCWGFAAAWSRNKVAGTLGPVSIALWFTFRGWKAECTRINDPKV
ncbi:MAG: hypothetical protein ACYS7Y_11980 [Planctomycetota bacterium]|jgi:hypothetical protein